MKNTIIGSLIVILLIGISACTKYDPIYGVADFKDKEVFTIKNDLVYIYKNNIYLADEVLSNRRQLTYSSFSKKTHVAISHKHSKIAYLNDNKEPIIIDSLGNPVETLPYSNVKDIKWLNDNGTETLVLLIGNQLFFHGSSPNLSSNVFGFAFPADTTFVAIDAFDINSDLDVVFTFRYQKPFSPTSLLRKFYHGVGINYQSSSLTDKQKSVEDGFYDPSSSSYASLPYPRPYMVNVDQGFNSASLGLVTNTLENDYEQYYMSKYNYSSNSISSFSVPYSTNFYEKNTKGNISNTVGRLTKYLVDIPAGIPEPTGTPNTFLLDFTSQNNTLPCYFDWNP